MQKEGSSKPVSFKCFNCNHQEIAWKDETGMIRFVCPHCGTITISKEKSRRHIQIDMYAPKGEHLRIDRCDVEGHRKVKVVGKEAQYDTDEIEMKCPQYEPTYP